MCSTDHLYKANGGKFCIFFDIPIADPILKKSKDELLV